MTIQQILLEAIGDNEETDDSIYTNRLFWKSGYNQALADLRAKIPEIEKKIVEEVRKDTLKELIQEYQVNELEGKGYDFYFAIRTKLDEIIETLNRYNEKLK
jgi:hypothetical protein